MRGSRASPLPGLVPEMTAVLEGVEEVEVVKIGMLLSMVALGLLRLFSVLQQAQPKL